MRVLVTRPEADAEPLVRALAERGIESIVAPLLTIRPLAVNLELDGVQAVLVTSANGARALGRLARGRDVPVLAVGPVSAEAAKSEGFADVRVAGGDVAALADLARNLDPGAGTLVHVAGRDTAGDLAGRLERLGFTVRRAVAYEALTASELPAPARSALEAGRIDAVLLFSPRTAATFLKLARSAGVALGRVDAVCLSAAVADAAKPLEWRRVRVARRPDTVALLDALGPARHTRK